MRGVCSSKSRRILSFLGILIFAAAASLLAAPSALAEDRVARYMAELAGGRSFKVRVEAAHLLAPLNDPRVPRALAQSLAHDRDEVVRVFVAKLLGRNPGGDQAGALPRAALLAATHDASAKVRKAAKAALVKLQAAVAATAGAASRVPANTLVPSAPASAGSLKIVVGQFADRSGHASAGFRERLRREVMQQLRGQRRVVVTDRMDAGVAFIVEGTIKRLAVVPQRGDMEATCAVDLVLSRPTRGILLVASGEASVQKTRFRFRPQQGAGMQEEAMTFAVQSAQETLGQFLARQ